MGLPFYPKQKTHQNQANALIQSQALQRNDEYKYQSLCQRSAVRTGNQNLGLGYLSTEIGSHHESRRRFTRSLSNLNTVKSSPLIGRPAPSVPLRFGGIDDVIPQACSHGDTAIDVFEWISVILSKSGPKKVFPGFENIKVAV